MGLMKEYPQYKSNRKIHVIAKSSSTNSGEYTVYGITIPPKIVKQYKKTFFAVVPCGDDILLRSGCVPL